MKKYIPTLCASFTFTWCFFIRYVSGAGFDMGHGLALFFTILPFVVALGFVIGKIIQSEYESCDFCLKHYGKA